jgi:hypothetical protein
LEGGFDAIEQAAAIDVEIHQPGQARRGEFAEVVVNPEVAVVVGQIDESVPAVPRSTLLITPTCSRPSR